MTIPGPFTLSQLAQNDYYPDEESLALAYAEAVNEEARDLKAAGAEAAYDDILMLLLEPGAGPILVLPTHRVIRGLGDPAVRSLRARLRELFEVREAFPDELVQAFGHVGGPGGDVGVAGDDGVAGAALEGEEGHRAVPKKGHDGRHADEQRESGGDVPNPDPHSCVSCGWPA